MGKIYCVVMETLYKIFLIPIFHAFFACFTQLGLYSCYNNEMEPFIVYSNLLFDFM